MTCFRSKFKNKLKTMSALARKNNYEQMLVFVSNQSITHNQKRFIGLSLLPSLFLFLYFSWALTDRWSSG